MTGLAFGDIDLKQTPPPTTTTTVRCACTRVYICKQIMEENNLETIARQTGPQSVFDVSQRGDWDHTRNETLNGKPCRQRGTILEELPKV